MGLECIHFYLTYTEFEFKMCDDKDDSFIDDEVFDSEADIDTSSLNLSKKERRAEARRKLERLREEQELKDQLNDDFYDFPLDDEL